MALSPAEYARLVVRLVDEKNLVPDSYSIGGVVEELEQLFARALNKERAVFMPTGTLLNGDTAFVVAINETLTRRPVADLAAAFVRAAKA